MARAWVPWFDSTLRGRAEDLIAMVTDADDRHLLRLWMDDPIRLTAFELMAVEERILPAIRLAVEGSDQQVKYRWVDSRTGEVDD